MSDQELDWALPGRSRRTGRILLVDDDPTSLKLLALRLQRKGHRVSTASSAGDALAEIEELQPDVVLLDIVMPGMSGLECLEVLRRNPKTTLLPVILISALDETEDVVEGLRRGANDYVTKPIDFQVLLARMATHLENARLLRRFESQSALLLKLATTDDLTGAFNRRCLFDTLETEIERAARHSRPLSVLMMDLDHFKRVNDDHGHAAGDMVLREFAERIRNNLRVTDSLHRYGGDEFCVLLPETDLGGCMVVGRRIRQVIADTPFDLGNCRLPVTTSIGATTYDAEATSALKRPMDLLKEADYALLKTKQQGRNLVTAYDPSQGSPTCLTPTADAPAPAAD